MIEVVGFAQPPAKLILICNWLGLYLMPWFIYLNDYFIPAEVRAFTIDDAVRAGLSIAR